MNNFNFVSYKSDDTPTITNNKLVDVEQRIINDYKNSGFTMSDYANAFRDLLKNEFSDEKIFTDKMSAYNAKSFEDLYDFLKENDLVIKDLENMRFLTFDQVKELTQMFDNFKEIED